MAARVVLTGQQPADVVAAAYGAADVFAFPSRTDTQALVLQEAALAGLPAVLADPVLHRYGALAGAGSAAPAPSRPRSPGPDRPARRPGAGRDGSGRRPPPARPSTPRPGTRAAVLGVYRSRRRPRRMRPDRRTRQCRRRVAVYR